MSEKIGIEETLDVIEFGVKISEGVALSMADGKLSWTDAVNFIDAITSVFPAIENIQNVPKELADLDAEEKEQIKNKVLEMLPEVGEKWVVVAENAIEAVFNIYKIVEAFLKR